MGDFFDLGFSIKVYRGRCPNWLKGPRLWLPCPSAPLHFQDGIGSPIIEKGIRGREPDVQPGLRELALAPRHDRDCMGRAIAENGYSQHGSSWNL